MSDECDHKGSGFGYCYRCGAVTDGSDKEENEIEGLKKQLFDATERAIQAEDQLSRLGYKKGCIGGCGFEDAFSYAETKIYRLWQDLFPPADKPFINDVISEIDIADERVRLGVLELRTKLDKVRNRMNDWKEACDDLAVPMSADEHSTTLGAVEIVLEILDGKDSK